MAACDLTNSNLRGKGLLGSLQIHNHDGTDTLQLHFKLHAVKTVISVHYNGGSDLYEVTFARIRRGGIETGEFDSIFCDGFRPVFETILGPFEESP